MASYFKAWHFSGPMVPTTLTYDFHILCICILRKISNMSQDYGRLPSGSLETLANTVTAVHNHRQGLAEYSRCLVPELEGTMLTPPSIDLAPVSVNLPSKYPPNHPSVSPFSVTCQPIMPFPKMVGGGVNQDEIVFNSIKGYTIKEGEKVDHVSHQISKFTLPTSWSWRLEC